MSKNSSCKDYRPLCYIDIREHKGSMKRNSGNPNLFMGALYFFLVFDNNVKNASKRWDSDVLAKIAFLLHLHIEYIIITTS